MSVNFTTNQTPVTLYGRTIHFRAREISGQTLFVPRHISYDVRGYWRVTLNNRVTEVTAGEDLHYSLNVAWKELKRRMSTELPPKRNRPLVHSVERKDKHIETGRAGVSLKVEKDACRIHVMQILDGKPVRCLVASIKLGELNPPWLSRNLSLAVKVRERYEELAATGQLRALVRNEDVIDNTIRGALPKSVTVAQVLAEYKRINGKAFVMPDKARTHTFGEAHIKINPHFEPNPVSTLAVTVCRWLFPRLAKLFGQLAQTLNNATRKLS